MAAAKKPTYYGKAEALSRGFDQAFGENWRTGDPLQEMLKYRIEISCVDCYYKAAGQDAKAAKPVPVVDVIKAVVVECDKKYKVKVKEEDTHIHLATLVREGYLFLDDAKANIIRGPYDHSL